MDVLAETEMRHYAGIHAENKFEFAERGSLNYIRGHDIFRKYSTECGAENRWSLVRRVLWHKGISGRDASDIMSAYYFIRSLTIAMSSDTVTTRRRYDGAPLRRGAATTAMTQAVIRCVGQHEKCAKLVPGWQPNWQCEANGGAQLNRVRNNVSMLQFKAELRQRFEATWFRS